MRQILDRGTAADPAPARKPYPCRKEEKQMNKLTQALMEELTVEYVKVGSLQIPESVVISWVIMLLLVVGPPMEEKYGSIPLLKGILFTALVTGVLQCVLFPRSGLLGASGIVFMLIMLSSLAGFSGGIPVTMLLVAALYLGQQIYDIIFVRDNVANFMHIVGGVCGTVFGYVNAGPRRKRKH